MIEGWASSAGAGLSASRSPAVGVFALRAFIPDAKGITAEADGIWSFPLARCAGQGKLRRGLLSAQPRTNAGLPAAPLPALLFATSGSCTENPGRESKRRERDEGA